MNQEREVVVSHLEDIDLAHVKIDALLDGIEMIITIVAAAMTINIAMMIGIVTRIDTLTEEVDEEVELLLK
jgi:hypothetical protein